MKGKLYIFALFVLAALTGCRKQAVPDVVPLLPEGAPEMVISVKADAPEPQFTFLFWHKEDFDRGLKDANQGIARPYHVSEPTGNIGDYTEPDASTNESSGEKKDYNTGRVYPDSYGIAVCTGYGPYDGVTPAVRKDLPVETPDYSVLNVKEPGVTDVVVSQNSLEGSSIYPFHGNLEFFHPQIQLTVDAKLAETMAKYIKNVKFTVNGANLLSALAWDAESDRYLPSARAAESWSCPESNYLNKGEYKTLGTVLVVPKESDDDFLMTSIEISLKGLISNTDTEDGALFNMSVIADLSGVTGGGLTLGDSYKIQLLFDEDQIEITAVKVPWEEGGNVLVPIHPIPAD